MGQKPSLNQNEEQGEICRTHGESASCRCGCVARIIGQVYGKLVTTRLASLVADSYHPGRISEKSAQQIILVVRVAEQFALDAGFVQETEANEYSLAKIIAAQKARDKETLVHLRQGLTQIKTQIAALAHENRRYLEESLRTIEDLVQIIVRNSDRSEHYGRDSYVRTGPVRRSGVVFGEV